VRLLALLGLTLSVFLFIEALAGSGGLPGCAPGSSCDTVLNSRWSQWLGLPVAAPALLLYATVLASSLHLHPQAPPSRQRFAWSFMIFASVTLLAAALWFTALQLWVIRALCKYCLAAHTTGFLLSVIILLRAPLRSLHPTRSAIALTLSLAAAVTLIAGQLLYLPPTTRTEHFTSIDFDTGPAPDRRISILGGRVQLSPLQFPIVGSPDAPLLIVELYDYTCPQCRLLHEQLAQVQNRYPSQLALVKLAVPLDSDCNPVVKKTADLHQHACELAQLAMAVWKADPSQFAPFDAWLFQPPQPPSPDQARAYAETLVTPQALQSALADPWITEQIPRNVTVYQLTGGALPQLITGSTLIRGRPDTTDELCAILELETSLRPAAP
jgi:uncharacterized membrane protein/protein-disulfide isomerase